MCLNTRFSDVTGAPFLLSEEEVGAAITEALSTPLLPLEDKTVPSTLLSEATVKALLNKAQPGFVNDNNGIDINSQKLSAGASIISSGINAGEDVFSISAHGGDFSTLFGTSHSSSPRTAPSLSVGEKGAPDLSTLGVLQKQLTNGMKVNLKSLDAESQRVSLRLYIPGILLLGVLCVCFVEFTIKCSVWNVLMMQSLSSANVFLLLVDCVLIIFGVLLIGGRLLETKNSPGAVALGARTMQEGTYHTVVIVIIVVIVESLLLLLLCE